MGKRKRSLPQINNESDSDECPTCGATVNSDSGVDTNLPECLYCMELDSVSVVDAKQAKRSEKPGVGPGIISAIKTLMFSKIALVLKSFAGDPKPSFVDPSIESQDSDDSNSGWTEHLQQTRCKYDEVQDWINNCNGANELPGSTVPAALDFESLNVEGRNKAKRRKIEKKKA